MLSVTAAILALAFPVPAPGLTGPVQRFELRFNPPLAQVSDVNRDQKMLAVQLKEGSQGPARVISIGKRGKVETVEELAAGELSVPAERLWIAGAAPGGPGGPQGEDQDRAAGPVRLPVTETRVYLSGGGETYTVVRKTLGAYYELRHKDKAGKLLFVTGPRDAYGFKDAIVSHDGSKVLVVDESPTSAGPDKKFGQRYCLYDRDGMLLSDVDNGDELDNWLDFAGGFLAEDGGWFITTRGMGGRPAASVVMLDGAGRVRWEKAYFTAHKLVEDYGGVFRIKGWSGTLLTFLDTSGELRTIERKGYGFDFWLSPGSTAAYAIIFKKFDFDRSGLPEEIKSAFPGADVVPVDLNALMPQGNFMPRVAISPDGKKFIHYSAEPLGMMRGTVMSCYDAKSNMVWRESFLQGDVVPRFVSGGRAFALTFGYPFKKIAFYDIIE